MKDAKRKKLKAAGWRTGSADTFLKLSKDESQQVAERLTPPQEGLTWVAVPDDAVTTHAIWHSTRSPVRLGGMANVVSPETILTLCGTALPRQQISRTAQTRPELSYARFCMCCEQGLRIPDGWTLEPFERQPDYALLSTPSPRRYMATIDFRARGVRSGYSVSGRFVGEEWNKRRKKPSGRGWKQALVDDAIAHLQEVLR